MTPAARIAAAIELLAAIETTRARPADAVANDFFRARRFIGAGDRRAVSDRAWQVLRTRRRLGWWLRDGQVTARIRTPQAATVPRARLPSPAGRRVAAARGLARWAAWRTAFSGGRFAPAPLSPAEHAALRRLEGHTLEHRGMPDAVRLEVPDWLLPRLAERFGPALEAELQALLQPAPLDLRANLLKTTRDAAAGGAGRRGTGRHPDAALALGPAHRRPPPGHRRPGLPVRPGRDPGRGQPARRRR